MRKTNPASSNPSKEDNSGSPHAGGPEFLVIGYLRRAHGLRGEMIMDVLTDFPERINPKKRSFWGKRTVK